MVKSISSRVALSLSMFLAFIGSAFSEEVTGVAAAVSASGPQAVSGTINYFIWTVIVASAGLALAAAVCGLAQSKAIRQGLEGMARQPEAGGQIQTALILGLAFIESLVIYVLLVALILLFANPFVKYFVR